MKCVKKNGRSSSFVCRSEKKKKKKKSTKGAR